MKLREHLKKMSSVFIDTAPIIYYIEAHTDYGPLVSEFVKAFQSGRLIAYSSVITIVEILPKPIANGDAQLAKQFSDFLSSGQGITTLDITSSIAQTAGRLRGQYGLS